MAQLILIIFYKIFQPILKFFIFSLLVFYNRI